jgi:hypothetical protein
VQIKGQVHFIGERILKNAKIWWGNSKIFLLKNHRARKTQRWGHNRRNHFTFASMGSL